MRGRSFDGARRARAYAALVGAGRTCALWIGALCALGASVTGRAGVDPLPLLGVALVLSPSVYQRLSRRSPADAPAYAGYAYVECPECRRVVPMSGEHCPVCGAKLFSQWTNPSRHA